MKAIAFDIESSGIEPEKHLLLEIAAAVVNVERGEPVEILERYHAVIKTDPKDFFARADECVVEMHDRSGLLQVLKDGEGVSEAEALEGLSVLFKSWPRAMLMGRNVGTFDAKWMEHRSPGITTPLHYRCIDLSSVLTLIKTFAHPFGPTLPEQPVGAHRATVDVEHDIETLNVLADWLEDAAAE